MWLAESYTHFDWLLLLICRRTTAEMTSPWATICILPRFVCQFFVLSTFCLHQCAITDQAFMEEISRFLWRGGGGGGGGRGKQFVFWILTSLNPKILIFLVLCYNNEEQMYSNIAWVSCALLSSLQYVGGTSVLVTWCWSAAYVVSY